MLTFFDVLLILIAKVSIVITLVEAPSSNLFIFLMVGAFIIHKLLFNLVILNGNVSIFPLY